MVKWLLLLIPLFGPTLLWLGWQAWRLRRAQAAGVPVEDEGHLIDRMPLVWLAPLSGALFVAMLVVFGIVTRAPPDSVYQPSTFQDGQIVPGRLAPEER